MEKIEITTETIQLDQFLKWAGVIESGGQVKNMIENLKNSDVVRISKVGSWQVVFKGER